MTQDVPFISSIPNLLILWNQLTFFSSWLFQPASLNCFPNWSLFICSHAILHFKWLNVANLHKLYYMHKLYYKNHAWFNTSWFSHHFFWSVVSLQLQLRLNAYCSERLQYLQTTVWCICYLLPAYYAYYNLH